MVLGGFSVIFIPLKYFVNSVIIFQDLENYPRCLWMQIIIHTYWFTRLSLVSETHTDAASKLTDNFSDEIT